MDANIERNGDPDIGPDACQELLGLRREYLHLTAELREEAR